MIAKSIWSNYFQTGKTALSAGDSVTAEAMFSEALEYASTHDLEPVFVANSAFGLALALVQLNATLQSSLQFSLQTPSHSCLQSSQKSSLRFSRNSSRKSEAQQLMRKAIRLYSTVQNLDCSVFVSCVSRLADSYCEESFPERAIPLLKQAVKVVSQAEGLAAPNLVPLFKRMALIYSERKYFGKAEACFMRAVQNS
ncbi:hypothetical protein BH11CYA1_BH11CYA1_15440 [soil metagenome]